MFTDMLLPIIARNADSGTLGGTTRRAGSIDWSFSISAVVRRRPRVLTQCPPLCARRLVKHGEQPRMTVLANPSLVAQLSISMTCVSSRGSTPRSRSLRSSLITLRRALPEVGGGRALARKARAGRGPSSSASMAWQGALARGHTKRFCRLSARTATIQTRGRDCGILNSFVSSMLHYL